MACGQCANSKSTGVVAKNAYVSKEALWSYRDIESILYDLLGNKVHVFVADICPGVNVKQQDCKDATKDWDLFCNGNRYCNDQGDAISIKQDLLCREKILYFYVDTDTSSETIEANTLQISTWAGRHGSIMLSRMVVEASS